ncbi:hypothetical protein BO82DRAFT_363614 [Aspergillus uvarum CBS 121591]|uniref:Uncharacterized protein n=1 Tax=Aspergillus uvarum CBS 121591 TaxID=1448315 RepID=A0A319CW41_9EURO|nr:hypothetical protein BO82DRAFT_363614 [Aspergillus uvarum CBS 121591]PYH83103.1 hypothetical protein BO82DRAFT_363614 [Aspergillus uvarum CBS 121591]
MFHLNVRMQRVGQELVTWWYDVQQLAFLHNLILINSKHSDLRWPDMDAFVKIHGKSHIFLATGILSATHFARDSRGSGPFHKPDGKNARMLKPTTTVANLFFTQYVSGGSPGKDVGIVHIDSILDELSQKSKLESSSSKKGLQQGANPELSLTRKWSNSHNVDILQLLASNIVLLIHHVARGSTQYGRAMGLGVGEGEEPVSRIVMSAGDVMRDYLKKNGGVTCKELRVFCKNKKPSQDDVAYDAGDSDALIDYWFSLEDVLGPKGIVSLMTGIPVA